MYVVHIYLNKYFRANIFVLFSIPELISMIGSDKKTVSTSTDITLKPDFINNMKKLLRTIHCSSIDTFG